MSDKGGMLVKCDILCFAMTTFIFVPGQCMLNSSVYLFGLINGLVSQVNNWFCDQGCGIHIVGVVSMCLERRGTEC